MISCKFLIYRVNFRVLWKMRALAGLIVVLASLPMAAVSENLDSLKTLINSGRGIARIDLLNEVAEQYRSYQPDSASHYARLALESSQKRDYHKGIVLAHTVMGFLARNNGDLKKALTHYGMLDSFPDVRIDSTRLGIIYNDRAILHDMSGDKSTSEVYFSKALWINRLTQNQLQSAISYNGLGIINMRNSDHAQALDFLFKSLALSEALNDSNRLASAYNNIGLVYDRQKNNEQALIYYHKSLAIDQALGNKRGMSSMYNNIGIIYENLRDPEQAMNYYHRSLKLKIELGDQKGIANQYSNIGIVYRGQGKFDLAMKYFQDCYKIRLAIDDRAGILRSMLNIGRLYLSQNKLQQALDYSQRGLEMTREAGLKFLMIEFFSTLTDIYEKLGDTGKALFYFKQYAAFKDSIFTEESSRKIAEVQTQYDTEKKQRKIEALHAETTILSRENEIKKLQIGVLITAVVLMLVISSMGILFFHQNRIRNQLKTSELRQKLLRTQMNPHFIYNFLASVQSYIYDRKPEEAVKYLSDFANLLRQMLENSRQEFISLQEELDGLGSYIRLQNLLVEKELKYSFDVDPKLDTTQWHIPPMLAQPFIENAIKHGLEHRQETGEIRISFKLDHHNCLLLEVRDNGIGITAARELKDPDSRHRSLATVITRERLALINQRQKEKIKLSIGEIYHNDQSVRGTKVSFSFPEKFGREQGKIDYPNMPPKSMLI